MRQAIILTELPITFSVETADVPQTAGTAGDQGAIASPPPSPRSLLCYTAQSSDDKLTYTASARCSISHTICRAKTNLRI